MQCTLDDIVTIAQAVSGINVTGENHSKYTDFLKRQIDKHGYVLEDKTELLEQRLRDYRAGKRIKSLTQGVLRNVPLTHMLADTLTVFSYLIRETRVDDTSSGEATILFGDKDLNLMRVVSSREEFPSEVIYKLYSRRMNQQGAHPNLALMSYIGIINDIGEDPEVVSVWGRKLTYNDDVRLADHRNHKHGGDPGTTAAAKAGINF